MRMRVLHVLPSLSIGWGGPPRVAADMCAEMEARGHDLAIFAGAGVGGHVPLPGGADWLPYPASRWDSVWPGLGAARRFPSPVEFDILHIHELWNFPGAILALRAKRAGVPYVLSVHGQLESSALARSSHKKRLYWAAVQSRIVRDAAAVHVLSTDEAADVKALAENANCVVVPNGVPSDVMELGRSEHQPHSDVPQAPLVLHMGRLHPKKRIEWSLAALEEIGDGLSFRFVVCGDGDASYVEKLRASYPVGWAEYRGIVGGMDRLDALRQADVFAAPYASEGMSLSVLEAMAAGCAVVAAKTAVTSDLAASGGVVVAESFAEFRSGLQNLIANAEERHRVAAAGRDFVTERYSWASLAGDIERMYLDAAGR